MIFKLVLFATSLFLYGCGGGGNESTTGATTAKIINNSDVNLNSMVIILNADTNNPTSHILEISPSLEPGKTKILGIDNKFCGVNLFIKSNITFADSASIDEFIVCGSSDFECQVRDSGDLLVSRYFTFCSHSPINVTPVVSNVSAEGDLVITQGDISILKAIGIIGSGSGVTYFWSIINKPSGSTSAMINERSITSSFLADFPGFYKLSLIATDSINNSSEYIFTVFSVPTGFFTLGSSTNDVISAQGVPSSINTTPFGYFDYNYGSNSIRFSTNTERVISWDNQAGSLSPIISFSSGTDTTIFAGSTNNDVARIQGVPTKIRLTSFGYYEWFYGGSKIRFSDSDNKVISFDNIDGNLIL